jgi:sucrose-6-phosphate hydrolase SacC (GH32 family)
LNEINKTLKQSDIAGQHTFELISTIGFGTAQEVGWRILQKNGAETVIGYDRNKGTLFLDRTHSGLIGFSRDFPARMEAPLRIAGSLEMEILVDRSSIEIFADGGRVAMTSLVFPPERANGIEAYAVNGKPDVFSATVWALKSAQ